MRRELERFYQELQSSHHRGQECIPMGADLRNCDRALISNLCDQIALSLASLANLMDEIDKRKDH